MLNPLFKNFIFIILIIMIIFIVTGKKFTTYFILILILGIIVLNPQNFKSALESLTEKVK